MKARMQEPFVRSNTRIVQAMTLNVKCQSAKIWNKKYRKIALLKRDWVSMNDFFYKMTIFLEKKLNFV